MFSGDHVMGWSTSIVAPPDGAMGDYMASLDKLAARDESDLPARATAAAIRDAPRFVAAYIRTARRARPRSCTGSQGRSRHPDAGARDLYRPRSAAGQRRRPVGAGASRGPGGARAGRDRGAAVDRAAFIGWRWLIRSGAASPAACLAFAASASRRPLRLCVVDRRRRCRRAALRTRAALVPKSWRP